MHNICLSSSFNDSSHLFHHTFQTNPLSNSTSSPPKCCICCCCATDCSLCNRLTTINPSFLCRGLRQSTLIQWSFCKRLIYFHGKSRPSHGNTSGFSSFTNLDRNYYYEKLSSFKEKPKQGRGFGHKRKKQFLSNVSNDNVHDVEVMLSLFTDEVGLEYNGVCDSKKKKNVASGVAKRDFKCDEVVKVRSMEERREKKMQNLQKTANLDSGRSMEEKKMQNLQKTANIESGRSMEERREKKMQNLKKTANLDSGKDGSNCSKESGKDFEVKSEGFIEEVVGNVDTRQECDKEQGKILEKKDTVKGYYGESIGVSQDWRKKSEKKLNQEFSQHQANVSVKIDDSCRQELRYEADRFTDESGSRMKYKRFKETSGKDYSVTESTSNSQKQYNGAEKKLKVISEVSKSRMNNWEETSRQVSTDEGVTETESRKSNESKLVSEQDKLKTPNDGSESSDQKDNGARHSSQGSGPKGPSDEMWHVTDTSTQEPSEPDAPENTCYSSENDGAIKTSGRSLWTIIGDVVRLRWPSPRSGSPTPNSTRGKCSSYPSANSEAWFSGQEQDDSNDDNMKNSPLSGSISLPIIEESCFPSSAVRMRRSPAIKKASEAGETDKSVIVLTEISQADESNSGKMVNPKIPELERSKHVSIERVGWEEAYALEAKQRKNDEKFMKEALLEAKKAADIWEVPVGAVLVQGDKIIARGHNLVEELRDSTAHAEMNCIREASTNLRSWRLLDTTLYVTLEPCPMCAGAILQARIDTIVWGAPNKLLGADGSWIRLFGDGGGGNGSMPTDKPPAPVHPFHPNMAVRRGVLAAECGEVMQHFFRLRRKKKTEPEPPAPPSSHNRHHSNFFSKMHHAFNIIFCL